MAFADIPEESSINTNSDFRRVEYCKIIPGVPVRLRILDKNAVHMRKYFLPRQRISIVAPENEADDPIWQRNGQLMKENPDKKTSEISGFIPRQNRYAVNVLNKTMVKRSPSGNVVFPTPKGFPTNDPETGELIANIDPEPLNRVEVLERGPRLFAQLNQINQQVCDDAGNPLGIWTYDIVISATGSGLNMVTNIIPYPNHDEPADVPEEELYDLENEVPIILEPEEISRLLEGVLLRDIFAARDTVNSGEDVIVDDDFDVDNLEENIESLFSDA